MELPLTGGCQCGKIRYEITESPTLVYTCHCREMRVLGGEPAEGWRDPCSGGHARRYVVATADPAYLDPEQAALGHASRGR